MKRRSFLVTSGSAVLSGTALNSLQKPAFGLNFELSTVPNAKPSNISSLLVQFSKFRLTPQYVNSEKDATINIEVKLGNSYTGSASKTVSVTNGQPVVSNDLGSELPIVLHGITSSEDSLSGEIVIRVSHDSIGEARYSRTFRITENSLLNKLEAYYPMENSGSGILQEGVNGGIAQINGASWVNKSVVGSHSLSFDGTNDRATAVKPTIQNNNMTVSAWIKADSQSGYAAVVSPDNNTPYYDWLLRRDSNNNYEFVVGDGSNQENEQTISDELIEDGEWHHIAGVCSGSKAIFYLDGVEKETSDPVTLGSETSGVSIGCYTTGGTDYCFSGLIDEVGLWDTALSEEEIQDLYNLTGPIGNEVTEDDVPSNSNGGVSRYKLNKNADDSWGSNNGNDTLTSGYGSGVYNNSKIFDGSTGYIEIPDDSSLGLTNLTISLWAYRNGSKSKEYLFDGRNHNYYIKLNDDTNKPLFGGYVNGNGQSIILDNPIPNRKWVHIVGTFDSNRLRLYVNGDLKKESSQLPSGFDTSSGVGRIGDYIGGGYKFKGRIDDVRIYNRSLAEKEIQRLFSLGSYNIS